jgi:hypothetical protein
MVKDSERLDPHIFEIWSLEFVWDLGFGFWDFHLNASSSSHR